VHSFFIPCRSRVRVLAASDCFFPKTLPCPLVEVKVGFLPHQLKVRARPLSSAKTHTYFTELEQGAGSRLHALCQFEHGAALRRLTFFRGRRSRRAPRSRSRGHSRAVSPIQRLPLCLPHQLIRLRTFHDSHRLRVLGPRLLSTLGPPDSNHIFSPWPRNELPLLLLSWFRSGG